MDPFIKVINAIFDFREPSHVQILGHYAKFEETSEKVSDEFSNLNI